MRLNNYAYAQKHGLYGIPSTTALPATGSDVFPNFWRVCGDISMSLVESVLGRGVVTVAGQTIKTRHI